MDGLGQSSWYCGSSTPTPSPRVQRKQFQGYGRPLLPGYAQTTVMTQGHHRTVTTDRKSSTETESSLRDAIPAMQRHIAVTCLVLNVLLPGLGTFVAGLTVLCGSVIRNKESTKPKIICSNTLVAFLQLVTAFLFLLGWIWSIVWGVAFLTISDDYFKEFKRSSMPIFKARSVDHPNGSDLGTVGRTGSTPMLATSGHLQKPIMLRSSSADQPTQQVIMLQKAPINSHSESSLVAKKTHQETKSRPQKGFKRPVSDDELTPFNTSHERLEHIVIHNLPRAPVRRGILRRDETITSTGSSISEAENPYS